MKKPHCDNCDALIAGDTATWQPRITVQPRGFNCGVEVTVKKFKNSSAEWQVQELCADCLRSAIAEFLAALKPVAPLPTQEPT